jgi:CheY-like chemotaxis protein
MQMMRGSAGAHARRSRAIRVLVAEDEADIRQLVVVALRCQGYDVIEARTGAELLDELGDSLIFGNRRKMPDIIISDIRMPGFTGLEILAGLRDAQWSTAVVLMTAFADPEIREEALRLGAQAFFEKPFDIDDLLTAVLNIQQSPPDSGRGFH